MSGNLLVQNGRLIDPDKKLDTVGDILVLNGKISKVGGKYKASEYNDLSVLDASGQIVCPGFIDLHCHLREPGYEDKETIRTGTMAAAAGGFSTVCCMPNTMPPLDNKSQVEFVTQTAEHDGVAKVLVIGCITKERKGLELTEMLELANAGVIGFSDDGSPVDNTKIMLLAMEYCSGSGLLIIDHCEDRELAAGGFINEGWVSARLGLKGIPAVAEEIILARDIALARITGSRLHIAHVSTAGSVDLVRRAKEAGVNITAEVTPHHLTLTEELVMGGYIGNTLLKPYDTNTKVNPPLRTQKDISALIEGLQDGTIDVIATDHAPHTTVDKNCEYGLASFGISGFETAFGCLMTLVNGGYLDFMNLIQKMSSSPAKVIGKKCSDTGVLEEGYKGDLAIFDPDMEWNVDYDKFFSKGKNSPYNGHTFKGKVKATVVDGEIVFNNGKIVTDNSR